MPDGCVSCEHTDLPFISTTKSLVQVFSRSFTSLCAIQEKGSVELLTQTSKSGSTHSRTIEVWTTLSIRTLPFHFVDGCCHQLTQVCTRYHVARPPTSAVNFWAIY